MAMLTITAELPDELIALLEGRGVLVIPARHGEIDAFTSAFAWQSVIIDTYIKEALASVEASDTPEAKKQQDIKTLRKSMKEAKAASDLIREFERRALFSPATLTRLDTERLQ